MEIEGKGRERKWSGGKEKEERERTHLAWIAKGEKGGGKQFE